MSFSRMRDQSLDVMFPVTSSSIVGSVAAFPAQRRAHRLRLGRGRAANRRFSSLACAAAITAFILVARSATGQPGRIGSSTAVEIAGPVTVMVWNRPVVVLRASLDGVTPDERAERVRDRIENLPNRLLTAKVNVQQARVGDLEGILIEVGQTILLGLVAQDLDPESRETLDDVGRRTAERIQEVLRARAEQQRLPVIVKGTALSLAATIGFLLFTWGVIRLRRVFLEKLDSWATRTGVSVRGIDVYPYLSAFVGSLVKLFSFAVVFAATYLWLTFVLVQFPYTEPWGESLGSFLGDLAGEFGIGILEAVPGFFTVLVLFILTRVVTRGVSSFFESVERGRIELAWLGADTARASRRLAVVIIWIFAITVAYPYIPGSQSQAFKGVSVFVGLMVSLGGAGFINQIMSGLVVVYARTFRIGDYVRVGDKEGVVTDVGALTTKIRTRALEEITVPNAVLVGTTVTNYTKLAGKDGAVVSTTLTIGYDAPWRQVHALLQLAAERVQGLRRMPKPTVLQRALSDFYVEYQMLAHLVRPDERISVLSDLHANIQDVFNEFEVQIMSPHFETQPGEKVIVKKDDWHASPAKEGESTDVAPR